MKIATWNVNSVRGIVAETATTAEQPPAPTGSTKLAFAGLTWQCKAEPRFGPGPNG